MFTQLVHASADSMEADETATDRALATCGVLGKEVPMREFKKMYRDDQDQKPEEGRRRSWFSRGLL